MAGHTCVYRQPGPTRMSSARIGTLARHLSTVPVAAGSPTVLIVGASRGIGLGLAKSYAASGWNCHCTTRTLENPGELGEIPGVTLHACDVAGLGAGPALAASLAGTPIDVLVRAG